eukprot:TRINITY_DN10672_c0_g1_i1.p1 TRINITY_DN10672_c0_g1~~TRINITY_DN10672_c0_g1_i1.p1  ORF type:complete len:531 (+),score=122.08 TRINITY_DN10672_c0_g1_i1:654-2246(+)
MLQQTKMKVIEAKSRISRVKSALMAQQNAAVDNDDDLVMPPGSSPSPSPAPPASDVPQRRREELKKARTSSHDDIHKSKHATAAALTPNRSLSTESLPPSQRTSPKKTTNSGTTRPQRELTEEIIDKMTNDDVGNTLLYEFNIEITEIDPKHWRQKLKELALTKERKPKRPLPATQPEVIVLLDSQEEEDEIAPLPPVQSQPYTNKTTNKTTSPTKSASQPAVSPSRAKSVSSIEQPIPRPPAVGKVARAATARPISPMESTTTTTTTTTTPTPLPPTPKGRPSAKKSKAIPGTDVIAPKAAAPKGRRKKQSAVWDVLKEQHEKEQQLAEDRGLRNALDAYDDLEFPRYTEAEIVTVVLSSEGGNAGDKNKRRERGLELVQTLWDAFTNLTFEGRKVSAGVPSSGEGSQKVDFHTVNIEFHSAAWKERERPYRQETGLKDLLVGKSCTCKDYETGFFCKHLSAVLYLFLQKPELFHAKMSADSLIAEAPKDQLVAILRALVGENRDIERRVTKALRLQQPLEPPSAPGKR